MHAQLHELLQEHQIKAVWVDKVATVYQVAWNAFHECA